MDFTVDAALRRALIRNILSFAPGFCTLQEHGAPAVYIRQDGSVAVTGHPKVQMLDDFEDKRLWSILHLVGRPAGASAAPLLLDARQGIDRFGASTNPQKLARDVLRKLEQKLLGHRSKAVA